MIRPVHAPGLRLVQAFEGLEDGDPSTVNLDPYLDPVGIWTIGWGHAIRQGTRFLRGEPDRAAALALYPLGLTRTQAETLLAADLMDTARDVASCVPETVTDNQFDALVSFAFNCGTSALRNSTLLKKLRAGDIPAAADQFLRWNKAGGLIFAGLTNRRRAERALFLEDTHAA